METNRKEKSIRVNWDADGGMESTFMGEEIPIELKKQNNNKPKRNENKKNIFIKEN